MMAWLIGGFGTLRLILCSQDDLVGRRLGSLVAVLPYKQYCSCKMTWWDHWLVCWWLRCPTINTVLARCLGGMMAWFVGGFSSLLLILCLQDALAG
jgi:hypothetical protein